jgi:hypothetical protein
LYSVTKQEFEMSAKALKKFTAIAEQAQESIDKFKEQLDKDPAHALSWGLDTFHNAARLKVAQMLVYGFTPTDGTTVYTVDQAVDFLTDRIMSKTRWPAQSTSPTSNLMEQYEAAAYAEALDELRYMV